MIFKRITPRNFGPFLGDMTLELEQDVTVLTGPNDVGKSSALRIFEVLLTTSASVERERNWYRNKEFIGKQVDDPDVTCEAVLSATPTSVALNPTWRLGDEITVFAHLNHAGRDYGLATLKRNNSTQQIPAVQTWPRLVRLPATHWLREEIQFEEMTDSEKDFVEFAFGNKTPQVRLREATRIDQKLLVKDAQKVLNDGLKQLFPDSLGLEFDLEIDESKGIIVSIVDRHRGYTPFELRGSGVRRLASAMGALLQIGRKTDEHVLVTFDEPETSLHADAQHLLRRVLEAAGDLPYVQVIYSTHSPAMINTVRPRTIRVFRRTESQGKAATEIVNDAYAKNFQLVRTSLGISAADSLLFGEITLIVEGVTECRCIPLVMQKLAENNVIDPTAWSVMMDRLHLVDGEGNSVEYLGRLAEYQRTHPIVLLDGDKSALAKRIRNERPAVKVIEFPQGREFEDIVPVEVYLAAVQDYLGEGALTITAKDFDQWRNNQPLHTSWMFSKWVQNWIEEIQDTLFNKPRIMQRAIELALPEKIIPDTFRQLLQTMCEVTKYKP